MVHGVSHERVGPGGIGNWIFQPYPSIVILNSITPKRASPIALEADGTYSAHAGRCAVVLGPLMTSLINVAGPSSIGGEWAAFYGN